MYTPLYAVFFKFYFLIIYLFPFGVKILCLCCVCHELWYKHVEVVIGMSQQMFDSHAQAIDGEEFFLSQMTKLETEKNHTPG